eukprot:1142704-Pelagomonas_calceolata.AAC.4
MARYENANNSDVQECHTKKPMVVDDTQDWSLSVEPAVSLPAFISAPEVVGAAGLQAAVGFPVVVGIALQLEAVVAVPHAVARLAGLLTVHAHAVAAAAAAAAAGCWA